MKVTTMSKPTETTAAPVVVVAPAKSTKAAAKKAAAKAPAKKAAAKVAKVAPAKKAAGKVAKAAKPRGGELASKKIKLLVKENPFRDGSIKAKRFAQYKNGITVGEYLSKVDFNTIKVDLENKLIALA